jgi:hypothetical protein
LDEVKITVAILVDCQPTKVEIAEVTDLRDLLSCGIRKIVELLELTELWNLGTQ